MKEFLSFCDKYTTVIVVLGIIFTGIIAFLFYIEKRLKKLEEKNH